MGARDLLTNLTAAGLSITVDGDNLVIRPRDLLTDELRAAVKAAKPELVDLLTWEPPAGAETWTDADLRRYWARHDRLLLWGWPAADAEALAARLVRRDHDATDDRVSCTECRNYRGGACANRLGAGMPTTAISQDLAALLQRCDGFRTAQIDTAQNRAVPESKVGLGTPGDGLKSQPVPRSTLGQPPIVPSFSRSTATLAS